MPSNFSTTRVDKRPIKEVFPNAIGIVKYAFTINDVDYYEFDDYNNMANDRAFHALSFYKELSMSCSRDYLLAYTQAIDDIINNTNGIRITEIVKLNMQLKERLELLIEPDIAYKLCGVVFFSDEENPNRFEFKYAINKAKVFKDAPMEDFFLSQPIVKLLPYINSLSKDFQEYCSMVNLITNEHIDHISMMLSETSKRNEWFSKLISQRPEVFQLMNAETYLSTNITST
jgi:hypothetical protein